MRKAFTLIECLIVIAIIAIIGTIVVQAIMDDNNHVINNSPSVSYNTYQIQVDPNYRIIEMVDNAAYEKNFWLYCEHVDDPNKKLAILVYQDHIQDKYFIETNFEINPEYGE